MLPIVLPNRRHQTELLNKREVFSLIHTRKTISYAFLCGSFIWLHFSLHFYERSAQRREIGLDSATRN